MKREAKLILPLGEKNKNKEFNNQLLRSLVDKFGGVTVSSVHGVWRDESGKFVRDDSVNAMVAYEVNTQNSDWLIEVARWWVKKTGEQCVYLSLPDRGVLFIDEVGVS